MVDSKKSVLGILGLSTPPIAAAAKSLSQKYDIPRCILLSTENNNISQSMVDSLVKWLVENSPIEEVQVIQIPSLGDDPNELFQSIKNALTSNVQHVFYGPGSKELNAYLSITSISADNEIGQWYKHDSHTDQISTNGPQMMNLQDVSLNPLPAELSINELKEILEFENLSLDIDTEFSLCRDNRLGISWNVGENQTDKKTLKNLRKEIQKSHTRVIQKIGFHTHIAIVNLPKKKQEVSRVTNFGDRFQKQGMRVRWI